MYGNRLTTADIRSITGSAREALVEVSFKIDNISLLIEPYDPSFPAYLEPIKGQVIEINATVVQADQEIGSLDIFRNLIVHFGFLTALVTATVGLTAAVTQQSKLALALGIMSLITVFFMASGFGLHVPVSLVMDDFCQKIDDYLTANDTSSELGILLSCINDGTFGDAFNSLSAVIQQEFINLNDTSTREAGYSFDPSLNAANNSLPAIADAAVSKLDSLKAAIAPYMASAPQDVQDRINEQIQRVQAVIDGIRQLLRIADCGFVASYAERIVTDVCVDVIGATIFIFVGQIVVAVIMIPYAILGFVAAYRFKRPYPDAVTPKSVRQPIFENPFIFNMIAVAAVGMTHALVALTDANINQWVPIAGLAVFLAVQIFGIIGAALRNKVMVIIYALLESVAFLLLLGVLIIFAIYLYGCNPEAPLYGPELCELFTDRTTTINNLILVCFVVVIGVFAIIYSWRMFLHLHRKKTYSHIVRQSTRSHLNVRQLNGSGSSAPLPGHVLKPSQGMSNPDIPNMRPVPTAYKGQLNMNAPEGIEMFQMPADAPLMDYSSSEEQSQSQQSQSQSHLDSVSRSQSVPDNAPEGSNDSDSESQSSSGSPAEDTRVDVNLNQPMQEASQSEESSEYESDNESASASDDKSQSSSESGSAESGSKSSSSADSDEWSHSEV
jgi:hypothetical protein